MDAIFGLLGFMGFIGGIIWLIYAAFKHKAKKKPLLLILVGAIIFIVGASLPSNGQANKTNQASTKSSETTRKTSKKIVIDSDKAVRKAIKQNTDGIKIIATNGSFIGHDDFVQVTIQADSENVTDKLHTFGMYSDINKIWKALNRSDLSQVSKVNVAVKDKLKDQDGNVSNVYVIKSEISKDKIKKINSKTFVVEDVPTYADSWYQHEALAKYN